MYNNVFIKVIPDYNQYKNSGSPNYYSLSCHFLSTCHFLKNNSLSFLYNDIIHGSIIKDLKKLFRLVCFCLLLIQFSHILLFIKILNADHIYIKKCENTNINKSSRST